MKALTLGVLVAVLAFALGCGDDDGADATNDGGSGGRGGATAEPGDDGHESGNGGDGGGGPAIDPGAEARQAGCERMCTTTAELPCGRTMETCVEACITDPLMVLLPCLAEYDAVVACVAPQPLDSFECLNDLPYPKESVCVEEQTAFLNCALTLN